MGSESSRVFQMSCLAGRADAGLEAKSFPRQKLFGWFLSDRPPSDKKELNSERE